MHAHDLPRFHDSELVQILLVFASAVTFAMTVTPPNKQAMSTAQQIQYWNRLRKFSSLIQLNNLTTYFERQGITVFVPMASAYEMFLGDAEKYGYDTEDKPSIENIILYHIGGTVTRVSGMAAQGVIKVFNPIPKYIYFNTFLDGERQMYTVNGAAIVQADILTSNGIIHIIDKFLVPVQSEKTVAEYLENPDIHNLSFQCIKNASVIDLSLKMETNSSSKQYTIFAPNDSYITVMPEYGKDILFNDTTLLKTVFWAHIIENNVLFLPSHGRVPNTAAKAGMLKFARYGTEMYVSNNKVRARIVQANIPMANGVIHVIDDLLFYIYRNIHQKIDQLTNAHFIRSNLARVDADLLMQLQHRTKRMTFFIPTDDAFAKLPANKQINLDRKPTLLTNMFRDHLVMYDSRDADSMHDGETFKTVDGHTLSIRRLAGEMYVEGGGVRAKVSVPDIGCTNGVIHLISSVLFQSDFTIWDAIQGNSQLSNMSELLKLNTKLVQTLNTTFHEPMTVFLISDSAVNSLRKETVTRLQMNPDLLFEAIYGSIAYGVILSSSPIIEELVVSTISGQNIKVKKNSKGLYIIGSNIQANVVIEDIWCSNGVLHITDNLVHLPTRNIIDQISVHTNLRVMTGLLEAYADIANVLKDPYKTFTMFVPNDDAFAHMPTNRAEKLADTTNNLLANILQAHIVPGEDRLIEDYSSYTKLSALRRQKLFILKSNGKAYALNNNVKSAVVEGNIRCTNGIIHVVDTLLHFPFWTVAETMKHMPELRPYYAHIQQVEDFQKWSSTLDASQTLFAPSASFLAALSDYHKTYIWTKSGLIRKLFESHFIPSLSLTQQYLNTVFETSRFYTATSAYNYTFTFYDIDSTNETERIAVDVGFINLRQTFDLALHGIGCSNGIIYIINGFLNYPLFDTLAELKRQPNLSIGSDQLLKLLPSNVSIDLTSQGTVYTLFAPVDNALDALTADDIVYINHNLTYIERMQVVQRHIVRGCIITYENIIDGYLANYALDRNITVVSKANGYYLRWHGIEAKIITPNILTTNGIIHIVDRLLVSTPCQTTVIPVTTTTVIPVMTTTVIPVMTTRGILSSAYSICAPSFVVLLNIAFALSCSTFIKLLNDVSR